jgi:hypothetical protein
MNNVTRNFEFEFYKNALRNRVNKNNRFKLNEFNGGGKPFARIQLKGNNKTFVNVEPVNNKSVYIVFGKTARNKQRTGLGTQMRKFVTNAANNNKKKVYQMTKNIFAMQKNQRNLHYSGRIMLKLGAKRISYKNIPKTLKNKIPNTGIPWFLYTPKNRS